MPYNGKSLCDECRTERHKRRKESDRIYNQKYRNKLTDKFYHSKEWKQLSKSILIKANTSGEGCAVCHKPATEVHHIEEVADNWERRFDVTNLMPLCTICHNKQRK